MKSAKSSSPTREIRTQFRSSGSAGTHDKVHKAARSILIMSRKRSDHLIPKAGRLARALMDADHSFLYVDVAGCWSEPNVQKETRRRSLAISATSARIVFDCERGGKPAAGSPAHSGPRARRRSLWRIRAPHCRRRAVPRACVGGANKVDRARIRARLEP